jgi:hypothetical protein
MRYKCFARIVNYNDFGEPEPMTQFSFDLIINSYLKSNSILIKDRTGNHQLIAAFGNTKGQVKIVNFNMILDKFKIEQNHQIFTTKKSIKCEIHSVKTLVTNERKKVLLNGYSNNQV